MKEMMRKCLLIKTNDEEMPINQDNSKAFTSMVDWLIAMTRKTDRDIIVGLRMLKLLSAMMDQLL